MRPFAARDADAFQRALDDPRGRSVSPAQARLVDTVGALALLAPPAPAREEFVSDLRTALLREAAALAHPAPPCPLLPAPTARVHRRHRGLAVAAGVATVVAATTSVSYAAQQALPGQALYPVKRALESAQVSLATGSGATGGLIDHAGRRLDEATDLTVRGGAVDRSQIAGTVSAFTTQASEAGHRALGSGDVDQVAELRHFTAQSMARLVTLQETAPASAHGVLLHAASELVALDALAVDQCGDCGVGELPRLTLPVTFTGGGLVTLEIFPGFGALGSTPVAGVSDPALLDTGGGWIVPGVPVTPEEPLPAGGVADAGSGGSGGSGVAPAAPASTTPGTSPGTTTTDSGSGSADPSGPADTVTPSPSSDTSGASGTGGTGGAASAGDGSTTTTDPVTTDPVTIDTGGADTGGTDAGTTDPVTTDPVTTDPGSSDPTTGDAVDTGGSVDTGSEVNVPDGASAREESTGPATDTATDAAAGTAEATATG